MNEGYVERGVNVLGCLLTRRSLPREERKRRHRSRRSTTTPSSPTTPPRKLPCTTTPSSRRRHTSRRRNTHRSHSTSTPSTSTTIPSSTLLAHSTSNSPSRQSAHPCSVAASPPCTTTLPPCRHRAASQAFSRRHSPHTLLLSQRRSRRPRVTITFSLVADRRTCNTATPRCPISRTKWLCHRVSRPSSNTSSTQAAMKVKTVSVSRTCRWPCPRCSA